MGILSQFNSDFESATIMDSEFSSPPLGEYQACLMKITVKQVVDKPIVEFAFQHLEMGTLFRKTHYVEANNLGRIKGDLYKMGLDLGNELDKLEKESVQAMAVGKVFNMRVFDNESPKTGKVYRNIWILSEAQVAGSESATPQFNNISNDDIESELERDQPYGF